MASKPNPASTSLSDPRPAWPNGDLSRGSVNHSRRFRYLNHAGFILVVLLGILSAHLDLVAPDETSAPLPPSAEEKQQVEVQFRLRPFPIAGAVGGAIGRQGQLYTLIPSRQRFDVIQYLVQPGDSLFGIADRFNLKPETVLWGNFDTLQDDPHSLQPGQELNILPVDGTLYSWNPGDTLIGVADFFEVQVEDIIDWPSNHLPQDIDPANPDIEPGFDLVIPGGTRQVVDWRGPRITRANPASARLLGPGYCGAVYDGPIGAGAFIWPTPGHTISGYHYDPVVHPAIDIGGSEGNAIFAAEAGVVVYAGWHNGGYGYVIVIDHGDGWQTLYAHLSLVNVGCGDAVFQGNVIGGMGCTGNCTGPHLHFEMMHDEYGKVNPIDFLP